MPYATQAMRLIIKEYDKLASAWLDDGGDNEEKSV